MSRFKKWKQPVFDKDGWTKYGWRCQHHKNLKIEDGVDIGCFTYLNAKNGIVIGEDVQIGSHCSIYSISTIDKKEGKVEIGLGSNIGTHSTIMPGVKIGKNVTIGAYSFVTEDIPDNCVAWGVPCKIQRREK